MDYTKISEVLIYKRKNDINDFGISNQGTLEHEFYTRLVDRPFLYENDENLYADFLIPCIFNHAAYIVTLIGMEEHPVLYLRQYYEIASRNPRSLLWNNHMFPATMALVYNWLNHIDALSANPESAMLKKKIYDNFADWDEKGAAGGKRDFYELINIPSPQISNFCAIDFTPRELSDICNADFADSTISRGLEYLISRSKIEGKELLLIERVKPIIHRLTNGGTTYHSTANLLQQAVEYLERILEEKDTKEEEASTSTADEQRIKELEQSNKKLMSEIRQLQADKDHHEDLQQAQPTIEQQQADKQSLTDTLDFDTYPALRLLATLVNDGRTPKDTLMPLRAAMDAGALLPPMPYVVDFNQIFGKNLSPANYSTYINAKNNPYENEHDVRRYRTLKKQFKEKRNDKNYEPEDDEFDDDE